jgi:hypothetical protein
VVLREGTEMELESLRVVTEVVMVAGRLQVFAKVEVLEEALFECVMLHQYFAG